MALIVVLASILVSTAVGLQQRGVGIVGEIPSGLPSVTVPALPSSSTVGSLVPVAGALFLGVLGFGMLWGVFGGVFVYRVEAPLFYANATGVRDDLLDHVDAEDSKDSPISLVVFDLVSAPGMDVTAGETLGEVAEELDDRGIALQVAGAEQSVVRLLEALGAVDEQLGAVDEQESIRSVIQRWQDEDGT